MKTNAELLNNALLHDIKDYSLPVNFRIYDPADGKTNNNYFVDMLKEVLA